MAASHGMVLNRVQTTVMRIEMERCIDRLDESQVAEVHLLMKEEWWCSDRTLEDVHAIVAGSNLTLAFLDDNGAINAFVRVLTDKVIKAVLFDVIVRTDYRDRGLGRTLVQRTINHPMLEAVQSIELYCPDRISGFYKGMGFDVSDSKLLRLSRT